MMICKNTLSTFVYETHDLVPNNIKRIITNIAKKKPMVMHPPLFSSSSNSATTPIFPKKNIATSTKRIRIVIITVIIDYFIIAPIRIHIRKNTKRKIHPLILSTVLDILSFFTCCGVLVSMFFRIHFLLYSSLFFS